MTKLTVDQKVALREVLKTKLSMGTAEVVFEKADGSIRTLKGTRDKDVIKKVVGEAAYNAYVTPEKARKESTDMVPLFDTSINEWRGFSIDKLISVNGVKVEHLIRLVG